MYQEKIEVRDRKDVMRKLSARLAGGRFDDATVEKLGAAVIDARIPVLHFDICKYGICIDYWWKGRLKEFDLREVLEIAPVDGYHVEVMEDGILNPEALRVRVGGVPRV